MIEVTLNSRWELRNVPSGTKKAIEKALTYKNPKYEQLGRLGKFRRHVSPMVCYASCLDGVLHVPRGVDLMAMIDQDEAIAGLDLSIDRVLADEPKSTFTLRPYQERCVDATIDSTQGYFVAPTGSGKTIIGLGIIARLQQRTLILVHTQELLKQWKAAIEKFLGVKPGHVGGGTDKRAPITVAMIQTLARRREVFDNFGLVLVDEVHHAPASTWAGVLDRCPATYRYGLSATPERRDGQEYLLGLYFGRELERVSRGEVLASGSVVPARVHTWRSQSWPDADEWHPMISGLVADESRNLHIARMACRACDDGPVLVLTDRIEHAERLHDLCMMGADSVLLHGQLKTDAREHAMQRAKRGADVTVATTGILGEGIDAAAWQTLVLALPVSGKGSRLMQMIGRIVRPAEGKEIATVVDIIDEHPMCLGAWKSRRATYKRQGIEVAA